VTGGEGNTRTPFDLINRQSRMYKSQTFSQANTAMLFFPQHWRQFVSFLDMQHVDTLSGIGGGGSTPCVPNLVSNTWFTSSPSKHWYAWLLRFVYEQGYYFLYNNFDDRTAFALPQALVPQQYGGSQQPGARNSVSYSLVHTLGSMHSSFPSSPLTPVYDMQFNRVSTPDVLAWRKHITSPSIMDQCWTMDQLAGKIRRDEAAAAEAIRIKEEEKARVKAEKAAKAAEEKARIKAEKDAKAKKDKAAKDAAAAAAAKKKKTADDAAKKKTAAADKDSKSKDKKPAADKKAADKKAADKKKTAAAAAGADKKKAADKKPAAAATPAKPKAKAKKPAPPADEEE
jgi:hypothetical protein